MRAQHRGSCEDAVLAQFLYWKVKVLSRALSLCPTLCNPKHCSLPGFSVHGISQARILEWIAIPFSRGSCQPRDQTQVSCIPRNFFTIWVTRSHITFEQLSLHSLFQLSWPAFHFSWPSLDNYINCFWNIFWFPQILPILWLPLKYYFLQKACPDLPRLD